MKKVLANLAGVALVLALAACSGSKDDTHSGSAEMAPASQEPKVAPAAETVAPDNADMQTGETTAR